jgi:hypothetical protein
VVVAGVSWRGGAFRPRTVVEYRLEPGPPSYAVVSVVSAGRAMPAEIELLEAHGSRTSSGAEVLVAAPGHLRGIRVAMPDHAARELAVWVHAVTPDGGSQPTHVELQVGPAGGGLVLEATRGAVHRLVMSGEDRNLVLAISLLPGAASR